MKIVIKIVYLELGDMVKVDHLKCIGKSDDIILQKGYGRPTLLRWSVELNHMRRGENGLRYLLKLSYPLIISFVFRTLFTFVDTIYASFLGDEAIAAIGLAIPIEFAMIAVWVGLSSGLTSYLSRGIVDPDPDAAYRPYIVAIRWILVGVIPVFFFGGISIYYIAPHTRLDSLVAQNFQVYGAVLLAGSALSAFWSIIPDSIVKAHQDTRSTMIAGMLSNMINLALNTLFLFVFHWGIFGIAFSTILGRFGGLLYAQHRAKQLEAEHWTDSATEVPASNGSQIPSRVALRKILQLAVPSSVTYILMASETAVVNYFLSDLSDSTAAIAAYAVYHRIYIFAIMPMIAVTVATLPFIARLFKEQKLLVIQDSFRGIMGVSVAFSFLIIAPLSLFAAKPILQFLASSDLLLDHGYFAMRLVPVFCIASIPMIFSKPLFEGFQMGRPPVILAMFRYVILAVPFCLIGKIVALNFGYRGFDGVMIGLLAATFISSGIAWLWAERHFAGIIHRRPL